MTGLLVVSAWLRALATPENLIRTQLELWYWGQRLQSEWLTFQMRTLEQPAIARAAPLLISVLALTAATVLFVAGLAVAIGSFAGSERASPNRV
ncbi:MAG TPA: hypothetical protein VFZ76_04520 [Anaerolineales bacterium]